MNWQIIFISNLKRCINRPSRLIIYLLIPLITLSLSLIVYSNNDVVKVSIVNNDLKLSDEIIKEISQIKNIKIYYKDMEKAKSNLIRGYSSCIITSNDTSNFDNSVQVIYFRNDEKVNYLINEINKLFDNLIIEEYINNTSAEKLFNNVDLELNSKGNENIDFGNSLLGFIMLINILVITNSFSNILEDKHSKIYHKILSTNTNCFQYILGNILWNFVISLFQSVILLSLISIFHINIGISIWNLLIIIILINIMSIAYGVLIISLVDSENQLPYVSTLIIFPTCMISGCLWPSYIMTETLQKVSYIFPQKNLLNLYTLYSLNKSYFMIIVTIVFIIIVSISMITIGYINLEKRHKF